jgi:protein tyrosine phosphatase (PTP) superfamily phosphohydrolase (DUF442 family)
VIAPGQETPKPSQNATEGFPEQRTCLRRAAVIDRGQSLRSVIGSVVNWNLFRGTGLALKPHKPPAKPGILTTLESQEVKIVAVKKNLTRVSTALLVAACLGSSAWAQHRVAIDNFGRVNDTYFRGAQPEAADYASLAAMGVKTIINLTSHDADPGEQAMVTRNGMAYLQIPMSTRVDPTNDQIATFLSVVNDPARQPVYVHCVGGRHRTGVMTAVYRMTHDGWTAARAFREMKQYKYGADFLHPEFKRFVYAYRPETSPIVATQITVTR